MRKFLAQLNSDDSGVVTIEYLVLGTFLALALIVGVNALAVGINNELGELSEAIMGFDQGFSVSGYSSCEARKDASGKTDNDGGIPDFRPNGGTTLVFVDFCTG